jgi:hypothetical protein
MNELKIHHVIVLVSLFLSVFGTLLVLEKINANAEPITGANTRVIELTEDKVQEQQVPQQSVVRIINLTDDS